jgi:hypothetical protein
MGGLFLCPQWVEMPRKQLEVCKYTSIKSANEQAPALRWDRLDCSKDRRDMT